MLNKLSVGINDGFHPNGERCITCNIGSDHSEMTFWIFNPGLILPAEYELFKRIAEACPDMLEIVPLTEDDLED